MTDRAEQMRTRVLELIQGWLTNSNAKDNEQCVNLLGALAGDVSIITIPRSCGETAWVSRAKELEDGLRAIRALEIGPGVAFMIRGIVEGLLPSPPTGRTNAEEEGR